MKGIFFTPYLATILLLFLSLSVFGQNNIDAIKKETWKEVNSTDIHKTEGYTAASPNEKIARDNVYFAQLLYEKSKTLSTEKQNAVLVEAKQTLLETITFYPSLYSTYMMLGIVTYSMNKNYIESASYFKTALLMNPNSKDANYNMGILELEREQFDTALYYLERVLKIDSTREYTHNSIARCHYRLGHIDEAIYYYSQAIALDNFDHISLYQLGLIYGRNKLELKKCITLIEKAISINPNQKEYYEDLCVAYGLKGDYISAQRVGELGIKKFPKHAPLYRNLAHTYKYLKEFKKQEKALEKANELEPED
ncbi:MAG: tetratricopeptide repeat protein [Chitinophagales bacterium]|jgi:tetratricopeptide (TPR) repeat protein|nr:tetratricopeptide repeat protein [Chitinophagales bacterium]